MNEVEKATIDKWTDEYIEQVARRLLTMYWDLNTHVSELEQAIIKEMMLMRDDLRDDASGEA